MASDKASLSYVYSYVLNKPILRTHRGQRINNVDKVCIGLGHMPQLVNIFLKHIHLQKLICLYLKLAFQILP